MEVLAALVGLTGVLVGGSIQWLAATRDQRTRFNIEQSAATRDFATRALKAADLLFVVHGLDLQTFEDQRDKIFTLMLTSST